jgi:hypothetical protein
MGERRGQATSSRGGRPRSTSPPRGGGGGCPWPPGRHGPAAAREGDLWCGGGEAVSTAIDRRDVPTRETPLHLAVRGEGAALGATDLGVCVGG